MIDNAILPCIKYCTTRNAVCSMFDFLFFEFLGWNVNLLGTELHWYDPTVSKHNSFSVQASVSSIHSFMLIQSAAWPSSVCWFRANPTSQIHAGSSLKMSLVLQFYLLVLQHTVCNILHESWTASHLDAQIDSLLNLAVWFVLTIVVKTFWLKYFNWFYERLNIYRQVFHFDLFARQYDPVEIFMFTVEFTFGIIFTDKIRLEDTHLIWYVCCLNLCSIWFADK